MRDPVKLHRAEARRATPAPHALDTDAKGYDAIHMKRTNLVLDERLLEEATRLAGGKTYSGTVNLALRDFVQRARARRILGLAGSGQWEGDLAQMRADAPRSGKGKR
jgi:Arc/MetJ family transcription regulator